jgi:HAD superfamily hydrolase (TIGR01509 family)
MARLLMPLPPDDADPTEVSIPWHVLRARGHQFTFATPDARPADADAIMLTGEGLDPWGQIPGLRRLVLVGRLLRANRAARAAYAALAADAAFRAPIAWAAIDPNDYDGLILPGGHRARGMRPYLESETLQAAVAAFFAAGKPVGAICHGVLLAARSRRADGKSVLHGRLTTALTWPLERAAWALARRTRFWDPLYYRTYPEVRGQKPGFMSVQAEVTRALARPSDFRDVPMREHQRARKTGGRARDSLTDDRPAFVLRDGPYVSARWPGDAHTFAKIFADVLAERERAVMPDEKLAALIFDVDGTLAETEELHRAAFNAAFAAAGLPWRWDVALYARLLKVTGGKERIAHYLTLLPDPPALDSAAIAALHADKTARYAELVESGGLALRSGVAALVESAGAAGLRLAIATTTSRPNVDALLARTFGRNPFDVIVAGDEVAAKKPAPDVYVEALRRLGLPAAACVAIEDTEQGLRSALGAGLACVVTKSVYGDGGNFAGALAVVASLGGVTLGTIAAWRAGTATRLTA